MSTLSQHLRAARASFCSIFHAAGSVPTTWGSSTRNVLAGGWRATPLLAGIAGTVSVLAICGTAAAGRLEPVNVTAGAFLFQKCASNKPIYTVPDGKLLIIEDASASAVDSGRNNEVIPNKEVELALLVGGRPFGGADHTIVAGTTLPVAGGRQLTAYAPPNSEVIFVISGCSDPVHASVSFTGRLVRFKTQSSP